MDSVAEEWRAVPGFEGKYEVSSYGQMRSLDRLVGPRRLRGQIMKVKYDRHGYIWYRPCSEGKYKPTSAHSMVAAAFIGPRPVGLHINHIDGNKTNNHYSNLEYVTPQQNAKHALDTGLMKRHGEENHQAKATAEQVRAGYELLLQGVGVTKAARAVGLSPITLQSVKGGWLWKSLNLPRLVCRGQKHSSEEECA